MNLYEAAFADAGGQTFNARLRCASDANAKDVANAMALKSDGKWTDLFKITKVDLPIMVGEDNSTPNFAADPDAASDVQRRARLSYTTGVNGNYIPVEIPSVKAAYLTKKMNGDGTTTENPLDEDGMALLLTENGAAATGLHLSHFILRNRRK